jgi:glycosyltransferase involved in cell wall biosynthesis
VPSRSPRVLVDSQAFQNPWSAERGIGRYLGELLHALGRDDGDLDLTCVLNPDLAVPQQIDQLAASGRVVYSDDLSPGDGDLFHVPSPFEPAPIDRVWPTPVRGLPLVVTVHDLIPFMLPDLYLTNPSESRWYKTRLELVRRAVRVIAISSATAGDVIEHAGVAPERVVFISAAPAERFKPHPDRSAGLREAQGSISGLRDGFILYPGGMDRRKNISGLVEAYAGLPPDVRRRHQLVVACQLTKDNRAELDRLLDRFRVTEDVLFPGYVRDETLALLYQSAELAVFPSLYEGFGLPVAEAIACGTPVIASGTSSIPELIDDKEALFDPYDPRSIREKLLHALREPTFLERLRGARLAKRHSWPVAARDTAAVYTTASLQRRSLRRLRPRVAVVAGDSSNATTDRGTVSLLAALGRRWDVDTFGDRKITCMPAGVDAHRLAQLDLVERTRGGYDAIFSILGDRAEDLGALSVVKATGGHVLLLGGALARLYARCARDRPDIEPRGFDGAVRAMYGKRLPLELARAGRITPSDADRVGLLMTAEVVANAAMVFVQSTYAKQLVRLDAGALQASKVAFVPLAFPEPSHDREARQPLVAARLTRGEREAAALFATLSLLASKSAELRFAIVVADRGRHLRSGVRRLAERYGIGSRIVSASESDHARWSPLVRGAAAALYVAEPRELVISPFLIECFSAGVATVSSEVESVRAFSDEVLIKLASDADPEVIASSLLTLIHEEQPTVAVAAAAYARANSSEALADRLHELIFG